MGRVYRELYEEALLSDGQYDIDREQKYFGKITVTHSEGKHNGHTYMTVSTMEELYGNAAAQQRLIREVKHCLLFYFNKMRISEHSKVLVACLGNDQVTADSLGAKVAEKLLVSSHFYKDEGTRNRYGNLCLVKSGVSGVTGIESFDMIYGTIRQIKPDLVIVIDTLSCSSLSRLGCTVQFSDGGIEPGGGVGNVKRRLTFDSLKIPVLAVGVPLVMYATKIVAEYSSGKIKMDEKLSELVIAAKEIDFTCRQYGDIIAEAINSVVHPKIFG